MKDVKIPLLIVVCLIIAFGLFPSRTQVARSAVTVAPGGVASNLTLWLKADAGVTESGGSVSAWADQSGNSRNVSQGSAANQPVIGAATLNGNPVLKFDGSNDRLVRTGTTANDYLSIATTVPPNGSNNTVGSLFTVGQATGNATFINQWNGSDSFALTVDIVTGKIRIGGRTFAQISVANNVPFIAGGLFAPGTNASMGYVNGGNETVVTAASNSVNTNPQQFTVGDTSAGGRPLNGLLGEVITYNRKLTDAERAQVESYLALKYGITLANGVNYVNSAGTTFWDATTNSGYPNDIAGIGIDDGSAFSRTNSRSANSDRIVTITGTLASMVNGEFLVWGNDNGATTLVGAGSVTGVTNANDRIGRIWKAQETGDVGTVTVEFDAAIIQTGEPYCLLVDDDANFANGGTVQVGCVYAGSPVSFSHDFNTANEPFFTLGKAPMPTAVTIASFSGQAAWGSGPQLAWETGNESGLSGFHIWRGSADAAETRLTDALIGAAGGLNGGEYTWQDSVTFTWGQRTYYWLEAVHGDGGSSFSGPVEVWGIGRLFLPAIGR